MVEDLAKCSDLVFLKEVIMDDDAKTTKAIGKWIEDGWKMDKKLHKHLVKNLADPTHQTRSITSHVYNIVNNKHAIVKGSRLTTYWASRLRRWLCYFIQTHKAQMTPSEEIYKKILASIKHIFGNHEFCTEQCPGRRKSAKAKAATDYAAKASSETVETDARKVRATAKASSDTIEIDVVDVPVDAKDMHQRPSLIVKDTDHDAAEVSPT